MHLREVRSWKALCLEWIRKSFAATASVESRDRAKSTWGDESLGLDTASQAVIEAKAARE